MDFNISPKMSDNTEIINIYTHIDYGFNNLLLPQRTIIPQTNSVGIDISELLPPGTTIPQTNSVGINISEIVIRKKGDCIDWINKFPDYVVFGINEANTSRPPEGTLCMFCKTQLAIHSVKKVISPVGQFAGWHYCDKCKTKY